VAIAFVALAGCGKKDNAISQAAKETAARLSPLGIAEVNAIAEEALHIPPSDDRPTTAPVVQPRRH
jgi:hypothetical protein